MADAPVVADITDLRGYFDHFKLGLARGWVSDPSTPGTPVVLSVEIDGEVVDETCAALVREDVRAIMHLQDNRVGFEWEVPVRFLDGRPHRLSFRGPDGKTLPHIGEGGIDDLREDCVFADRPVVTVRGWVDEYARGAIRGWALRHVGHADRGRGGCTIAVTCEGVRVGQVKADRYRLDVAGALGCEPNCGFEFVVPPRYRRTYEQTFRFHLVPEGVELENSPLRTSGVDDGLEIRLLAIAERVGRIHREVLADLTALRRDVATLLPEPRHTVEDYDRWARRYYDSLRARVALARADAPADDRAAPLVSVIMPAYRPSLGDFTAAIESVLAQTWRNWELVIVDDGGKSPEVTRCMDAFAARDKRIRPIKRQRNVGIARATNVAIEAARGSFVAFFDHDDLLVDVALEVMMRNAACTGARVLYSDEDKIDGAGYFTEPNFKPDWNHRYMLGCNYVCHLLVVAADLLRDVGPLRPEYDGAQDHDLILRLAEAVEPERIHHVAEMLYHWRKTPNSTASDISNKGYAVAAGVRAVSDHLARLGRAATVSSVDQLTIYRAEFRLDRTPTVAIVMPYKDEIDTTRSAVEILLARTPHERLEIILVDNWSVTTEAAAFRDSWAGHQIVRVLHVEEPFNYSRLNNLAAASTDAEFLVFCNNDVFVREDGWLPRMLGEMADPVVAAVGAKLVYPGGGVQHAGVLCGVHGVAAHMHAGIAAADYGYIGRARLSQELTAVTAALMLVRHDAFRAVGGFDENALKVAYNDVDLCLRLRAAGRRIVLNADTVADHHESLSRGNDLRPEQEDRFFGEQQAMFDRWRGHPLFERDPAYNPWLSRDERPFFDLRDPAGDAPGERAVAV